jgi:hypothetical protein
MSQYGEKLVQAFHNHLDVNKPDIRQPSLLLILESSHTIRANLFNALSTISVLILPIGILGLSIMMNEDILKGTGTRIFWFRKADICEDTILSVSTGNCSFGTVDEKF